MITNSKGVPKGGRKSFDTTFLERIIETTAVLKLLSSQINRLFVKP